MSATAERQLQGRQFGIVLLAPLAGSFVTLSLAPFHLWPAGILSCCIYLALLRHCSATRALLVGWLYGLGMFGSGISWVFVSIHEHGNAGLPLAGFLTALLTAGLALLHAVFAWLYAICLRERMAGMLVGFPALWVLFEWLRSWLLTGFPWLFLGYSALDTWASGWAPVGGVYSVSLVCAFSASCLYLAWMRRHPQAYWIYGTMVAALWLIGWQLQQAKWVAPARPQPLSVALVQANNPQHLKWRPAYYQATLDQYREMTEPLLGSDLVLWPEAAIPNYYQRAQDFLQPLSERAAASNTALISGIPWRQSGRTYNSIVALGEASGNYHKQRLVPFGEYVPLEDWLGGLIELFELPLPAASVGAPDQGPLLAQDFRLAPFICYEIVYPDLVRDYTRDTDLMLTVSNDSWFGSSIGPLQHLQMARMRALENGRYLVRATNNGVTAIIDQRGRVVAQTEQFTTTTLRGEVQVMLGSTPFSRIGSWPVLALCWLILLLLLMAESLGFHLRHE